jgi:hypothetical protein
MLLYFSFILITSCLYVSEIAGRVIHLIKINSTVFFCTEEVVKYFTDFIGRHVVLMILGSKDIEVPFCEIGRMDSPDIIDDLET